MRAAACRGGGAGFSHSRLARAFLRPKPMALAISNSTHDMEAKEDKKQRRLMRNRLSAQLHRERQRAYMSALQHNVAALTAERDALRAILGTLQHHHPDIYSDLALPRRAEEIAPSAVSPGEGNDELMDELLRKARSQIVVRGGGGSSSSSSAAAHRRASLTARRTPVVTTPAATHSGTAALSMSARPNAGLRASKRAAPGVDVRATAELPEPLLMDADSESGFSSDDSTIETLTVKSTVSMAPVRHGSGLSKSQVVVSPSSRSSSLSVRGTPSSFTPPTGTCSPSLPIHSASSVSVVRGAPLPEQALGLGCSVPQPQPTVGIPFSHEDLQGHENHHHDHVDVDDGLRDITAIHACKRMARLSQPAAGSTVVTPIAAAVWTEPLAMTIGAPYVAGADQSLHATGLDLDLELGSPIVVAPPVPPSSGPMLGLFAEPLADADVPATEIFGIGGSLLGHPVVPAAVDDDLVDTVLDL